MKHASPLPRGARELHPNIAELLVSHRECFRKGVSLISAILGCNHRVPPRGVNSSLACMRATFVSVRARCEPVAARSGPGRARAGSPTPGEVEASCRHALSSQHSHSLLLVSLPGTDFQNSQNSGARNARSTLPALCGSRATTGPQGGPTSPQVSWMLAPSWMKAAKSLKAQSQPSP